jgi:dihydroneopterin aldolase
MTDRISIRGLRAFGYHGVFEHERREGQEFIVDVHLDVDTRPAAETDDLALTVHYGMLAESVAAVVTGEPVDLIETLAARIVDVCLADPRVDAAEVTVHKPSAPVSLPFDDISVTIRRERDA